MLNCSIVLPPFDQFNQVLLGNAELTGLDQELLDIVVVEIVLAALHDK